MTNDRNIPAHVKAWAETETRSERKIPWKPGPESNVRFPTPSAPMPVDLFKICLRDIGINQSELARLIDVDPRTVRSWVSGAYPVPLAVGFLICLMVRTQTKPEDL
jgi:DNA-binding XRE family transcriptional regulator